MERTEKTIKKINKTVGVVRERERVRLEKKDSLLKDVKTISYVNEDIRWTVWRERAID